jgi:hypothetical protein
LLQNVGVRFVVMLLASPSVISFHFVFPIGAFKFLQKLKPIQSEQSHHLWHPYASKILNAFTQKKVETEEEEEEREDEELTAVVTTKPSAHLMEEVCISFSFSLSFFLNFLSYAFFFFFHFAQALTMVEAFFVHYSKEQLVRLLSGIVANSIHQLNFRRMESVKTIKSKKKKYITFISFISFVVEPLHPLV